MRLLNLGCGERFHPDWVNLDSHPANSAVLAHDLTQGIPYPDLAFDVVYLSHVLEHFSKSVGAVLLQECRRVLRPGGVIRLVVPDLQRIAELYLEELRKLASSNSNDTNAYDWMILELYDQTVREKSGGAMVEFIRSASKSDLEFVRARLGGELDRILAGIHSTTSQPRTPARANFGLSAIRRKLLRLLIGRDGIRAYDVGRFRLSGEMHLWMYDHFSLARALKDANFVQVVRVRATESSIPAWTSFHLDTEPNGRVYKPDSLYMEAKRP